MQQFSGEHPVWAGAAACGCRPPYNPGVGGRLRHMAYGVFPRMWLCCAGVALLLCNSEAVSLYRAAAVTKTDNDKYPGLCSTKECSKMNVTLL